MTPRLTPSLVTTRPERSPTSCPPTFRLVASEVHGDSHVEIKVCLQLPVPGKPGSLIEVRPRRVLPELPWVHRSWGTEERVGTYLLRLHFPSLPSRWFSSVTYSPHPYKGFHGGGVCNITSQLNPKFLQRSSWPWQNEQSSLSQQRKPLGAWKLPTSLIICLWQQPIPGLGDLSCGCANDYHPSQILSQVPRSWEACLTMLDCSSCCKLPHGFLGQTPTHLQSQMLTFSSPYSSVTPATISLEAFLTEHSIISKYGPSVSPLCT
ncbi:uncharacterized protein LOC119533101 [Choloepus didactylus]|uniref:uncharacterized protein LOC119533101 n=1 Tax=Choloepus didactylus TaxID=27675 RepID=UPI00189D6084|nr:uncharacterized protein LOC119533101 [Choloepus didactylus]